MIFGGSFSPPTVAHEAIIEACLALPDFDEVWLMPSGDRADKRMTAPDADRLAMVQIVKEARFSSDPRLVVSDFELKLPRPTTTERTMRELAAAYPRTAFWLVIGFDSYADMPNWEDGATLRQSLNLVVFSDEPQKIPHLPNIVPMELAQVFSNVSSTEVRQALARGMPPEGVSEAVKTYIKNHGLFS